MAVPWLKQNLRYRLFERKAKVVNYAHARSEALDPFLCRGTALDEKSSVAFLELYHSTGIMQTKEKAPDRKKHDFVISLLCLDLVPFRA
jgi:hypothetical protein